MNAPYTREIVRFANFELDTAAYELRRKGRPIRLERQPMDLLILLVTRRGELVTRDEIIATLWGNGVFVDVETGVNTAVRKIRQALNDSSDEPAFIETVTGKGYRFAANIEVKRSRAPGESWIMVAVLPFVNLSGDPSHDYLADGLTDDMIALLSQLDPQRLRVIGRRSAMSYKCSAKPLTTIGIELNVEFIVEGSIRNVGDQWQIRCTLNRASDQVQLWSYSYHRDLVSSVAMQHELAFAITEQVKVYVSPERLESVARRHSVDTTAYDLCLRGRRFWNQLTPATTRLAIEYYIRATDIDRDYALAWAGLAEAFASAPINGDADPRVMWPRAQDAARSAIRANPGLSEAQHVSGQVQWFFEWDFSAAETAFRKAVELDPSNAWAHTMLSHVVSQMGRHKEARALMEQAFFLEPLSPLHQAMWSQVSFQARDHEHAAERARRAIVLDPEFWVGYMMLGQASEQLGEMDIALDALTTATRLSAGNSKPVGLRGYILAKTGQIRAAHEMLALFDELSRTRYVPMYASALIYAGLQEDQDVFDALELAYASRDVHLLFLPVDPKWDRFRAQPRFEVLLHQCGFKTNEQP
jgi:TolB-like protein/Flp pilus assembly protein TadD